MEADDVFIESRTKPISKVPTMVFGNMPNDGGALIIEENERDEFINAEPKAKKYIRKFLGAEEFINNKKRYCLWLVGATPSELRSMPLVMERIEKVKTHREKSPRSKTRELSNTPSLFGEIRQPEGMPYLLVPRVSSEKRYYVPIGFLDNSTIAGDSTLIVPNASLYHFAILTSQMHMAWMRAVAGRLELRYRYSKDVVYNNFPWPKVSLEEKEAIAQKGQAVLDARAKYPASSLADLYDPLTMPACLVKAHSALNIAVDRLYRKENFINDIERLSHLFEMYQKIVN